MRLLFFILFQVLASVFMAQAQLCTGSLGDPVVHITFGSGGNPGPSLRSTTYGYISTDCPQDGNYTIRNSTNGCHGNTWHTLNEDHTTGDVNGYFMLVNASVSSGVFYIDTVHGLCTNTTYEFAAWVINVLKPSACNGNGTDPNLTFNIETTTGTVLATYNSGDIPEDGSPTWKQYGLFFQTTATTTDVVVRITNNSPGGCGNDLGLDDITFRPCGPRVNATLTITGDTTAQLCEGNPTILNLGSAYSAGYNSPTFQWQVSKDGGAWTDINGETNSSYTRNPTAPGNYRYRLTMSELTNAAFVNCRVASNLVSIAVNPLPDAQLPDTTKVCEGKDIQLKALGGATWTWTGPNSFSSTQSNPLLPAVQPNVAGKYYVDAVSDKGCGQRDSTWVVVNPAVTAVAGQDDDAICEGASVNLHASGGIRYEWTPASGLSSSSSANPVASPADTTTYLTTVYNQFGCFDTASLVVNVWKKPVANAGPDKKTLEGTPVELNGLAQGTNVSYHWTQPVYIDDPALLQPTVTPPQDITYTLTVVSNFGCGTSMDNVFVRVFKEVKVPNAFSPNGDGINDVWDIVALEFYPEADIQVFDRQGQMIWQSRGYPRPWNGTRNGRPVPVGTYYYVIDLKTELFPKKSGWIFIVR